MKIEFRRLTEAPRSELIDLLNHPLVRRYMPLAKKTIDEAGCDQFLASKEQVWIKHGYGPWAIFLDGKFAGWGGFQNEEGDADLALVLHPNYWGYGKVIYEKMIKKGFEEMGFESITILLPPSRTRTRGLERLNFQSDGEVLIEGEKFLRYRLFRK